MRVRAASETQLILKCEQQLESALETQYTRCDPSANGRARDQGANQVVGQKMDCDFLVNHGGRLGVQDVHAHHRLDRTQIDLDLPATVVEGIEFERGDRARVGEPCADAPMTLYLPLGLS